MRPSGSPEFLEQRRHRAITLLQQGHPPVEVAKLVGADRRSVRRWKSAFRRHGRQALRAQPAPGRTPKLTVRQQAKLERTLLHGAQAAGFPTDLWTCPRVAVLIAALFGVTYHVDHIGRLLHGLGWSPQRPARRARERNEKETQRWLKKQWPVIKKKPGP